MLELFGAAAVALALLLSSAAPGNAPVGTSGSAVYTANDPTDPPTGGAGGGSLTDPPDGTGGGGS